MGLAIIIGVVILGLILAAAIYVSQVIRKEDTKPPDGDNGDDSRP